MLLAALTGVGQAGAAGWEYAFLIEESGTIVWDTPTQSLYAKPGVYKTLLTTLKCKTINDHPRFSFFSCVGQQGWEYMGSQKFGIEDATYIFKRPKK